MKSLGLQVANVGARDLALGPAALRGIADSVGVQLVSANILQHGKAWLPPYVLMRRELGGRSVGIGITGVTMALPSVLEALPDSLGFEIRDPYDAARSMLAVLEGQSDIQILMAFVPALDLERKSAQLGEYDLLVCGSGDHKEAGEPGPTPRVLAPGTRCKYLGWTAVRPAPGRTVEVTAGAMVTLDTQVPDDPAAARLVSDLQARLGGPATTEELHRPVIISGPSARTAH